MGKRRQSIAPATTAAAAASSLQPAPRSAAAAFGATPAGRPHTHRQEPTEEPHIGWFSALTTYLGYAVLIVFGHIRDFIAKRTGHSRYFGPNSRPPKVRGR